MIETRQPSTAKTESHPKSQRTHDHVGASSSNHCHSDHESIAGIRVKWPEMLVDGRIPVWEATPSAFCGPAREREGGLIRVD